MSPLSKSTALEDIPCLVEADAEPPVAGPPQYEPECEPQAAVPPPRDPLAQQTPAAAGGFAGAYAMAHDLLTSPAVLKALVGAFVCVLLVCVFPVEDYVFRHIPAAATLPNAPAVVKALLAAVAVTAVRPP